MLLKQNPYVTEISSQATKRQKNKNLIPFWSGRFATLKVWGLCWKGVAWVFSSSAAQKDSAHMYVYIYIYDL